MKLLSLKLDSFSDERIGLERAQFGAFDFFVTSDIFDHFICIEPDKKKSEGFFSKLFKSSSSSDSGSTLKSSWNTNATSVKFTDV